MLTATTATVVTIVENRLTVFYGGDVLNTGNSRIYIEGIDLYVNRL